MRAVIGDERPRRRVAKVAALVPPPEELVTRRAVGIQREHLLAGGVLRWIDPQFVREITVPTWNGVAAPPTCVTRGSGPTSSCRLNAAEVPSPAGAPVAPGSRCYMWR